MSTTPGMELGEPVLLASYTTITRGGSSTPDLRPLQNVYRTPCAIEQIRFIVRGLDEIVQTPRFYRGPGGIVRVRLSMGRMPLTQGHVPIWLLGPEVQTLAEEESGVSSTYSVSTQHVAYATYRWRLPHPLIVPVGAVITPELAFYNDPLVTNLASAGATLRVDVAYAGRVLLPGARAPEVQPIPYASAATFDQRADGSVVRYSVENELNNPFQVPLRLHRLVARAQASDGTQVYDQTAYDATKMVQIRESKGYAVTMRPTLYTYLSDPYRRAWTFDGSLDPKERLQVELSFDPAAAYKPMFGLVGWRNERIAP